MTERLIDRVERLEAATALKKEEPKPMFRIKLPRLRIRARDARAAKKGKKPVALVLTRNHQVVLMPGEWHDGNIKVGDISYEYDPTALFFYNGVPLVVLIQWRTLPVGGVVESYKYEVLGGENDVAISEKYHLFAKGQEVIIREIQQASVDDAKTKKGGLSPLVWVLIAGAVIYIISKLFGG